jgi:glucose dehydrogenase
LTVLTGSVGAQTTSPPVGDPAGSEWLTYGGNLFNQRYSGLEQINTSNVANLKAAWTFHTDAMGPFTAFESVPIVAGGLLFLTGPQSQIWALDPKSGQEVWHYFPD